MDACTYTLTVTTITDANHNPVTVNATITVNKLKTDITASEITTTYNVNKYLVITLKDADGKPLNGTNVTVDLNGAKTYVTDSNGQVKVPTKGLTPKTYVARITFDGNNIYAKSASDVKVTVNKATPKLTAKAKTFKTSVKTKKYTVTLKDNTGKAIKKAKVTLKVKGKTYKAKTNSKGKATFKTLKSGQTPIQKAKVTIKIGKKTYKATTNAKGKATFKIKKLTKKGKYKATVTYKGDAYYNKATKKIKITIK